MVKKICRCVFDTDKATLIKKYTVSYFGDPKGYEEVLYKAESGESYFMYVNGGSEYKYPKEDILRVEKADVQKWLDERN